ncbi:MAG: hypothetical protein IJX06_02890 [Clostridia bacterium]|nr:hypothetical protein [Clostridia bacterium]
MKKKNLIILLLMPFLIASLCIATVNTTFHIVDVDITGIQWSYDDREPFKLTDKLVQLSAIAVTQKNTTIGEGNDLVWSLRNKDANDTEVYAEIVQQNNKYYLKTLKEGEVIITCSNRNGNVSKSMTGVIFDKALLLVQPTITGSQDNIDPNTYYGQYDLKNGEKVAANIDLKITAIPSTILDTVKIKNAQNVTVDVQSSKATITGTGDATFTIYCDDPSVTDVEISDTMSFKVVEGGVNVYTYSDLLACTNRSETGEIVVLRKSFESYQNAYVLGENDKPTLQNGNPIPIENNVTCFGNYNPSLGKCVFNLENKEYCKMKTTYNSEYIDGWNNFVEANKKYRKLYPDVFIGLHVKKDFYGNGYKLNFHNLTYPSSHRNVGESGNQISVPALADTDKFRGTLPFFTLGDPTNEPLISALGQDNIGMLIDGDGILVNDVNVRSCDFGNMIETLDTVGTTIEIMGDNVTIINSRFSNGRNVMRSFSNHNLTVSNCLLSYSRNFLFLTGANEYFDVDEKTVHTFVTGENQTIKEFLAPNEAGDKVLSNFIALNTSDKETINAYKEALLSMQKALNYSAKMQNQYMGSTVIEDTLFYKGGVSAICVESLFNGPFLYNSAPSSISELLSMTGEGGEPIVPYKATGVSGVSYPVEVNIKGKTKFLGYKTVNDYDLSGMIDENMTEVASDTGQYDGAISIDQIFPLKTYMIREANNAGASFARDGKTYYNVPIAFYGGGLNLSTVNVEGQSLTDNFTDEFEVDLLTAYLQLKSSSDLGVIKNMIVRMVTAVTGFEPFRFRAIKGGYLFDETPKTIDLITNAKEFGL